MKRAVIGGLISVVAVALFVVVAIFVFNAAPQRGETNETAINYNDDLNGISPNSKPLKSVDEQIAELRADPNLSPEEVDYFIDKMFGISPESYGVTVFSPVNIKLTGKDSAKFSLEYGGMALADDLLPAAVLSIRSLDGRYYTISNIKWLPSYHDTNGTMGQVEKKRADGWEPYFNLELQHGWYGMFSQSDVDHCLVRPDEALSFACTLPFWEEGSYRATVVIKEYDPEGKCSGDGEYDICFEYEIPARTDSDMDVAYAVLKVDDKTADGEAVAYLDLGLLANSKARYIQPDSILFEGVSPALSVSSTHGGTETLLQSYVTQYEKLLNNTSAFFADKDAFDEQSRLSVVPLQTMALRGWDYNRRYNLSMTFAENPDGSGEQYTLMLNLRFDE